MIEIRDASPTDIDAITEITNALIETTTYEWTSTPHTIADRLEWLDRHRADGHPVLVAVDGDPGSDPGSEPGSEHAPVVGWAGYGDFRDTARWPGYLPVVEHTIHIREGCWGRGIGRQLIDALTERARADGRRAMVGAIDGENVDSIEFHRRLGFVEVGRLPGIGEKFGRPLDLVLMQLTL
jgi:phosphinothricin acetyltransferase